MILIALLRCRHAFWRVGFRSRMQQSALATAAEDNEQMLPHQQQQVDGNDWNALLYAKFKRDQRKTALPAVSIRSVNNVLRRWAKSERQDACEQALSLLETMEATFGTVPDVQSFLAVLNAYANRGDPIQCTKLLAKVLRNNTNNNIKPSASLYNTLLLAWSKASKEYANEAPERAEAVLKLLDEHPNLQANAISYNAVLTCWARSDQLRAPQRAEAIFSRHPGPDRASFTALMKVHAQRGNSKRTLELLNEMEHDDDLHPNNQTPYCIAMQSLKRSSNVARVEAVFRRIREPNAMAYAALLHVVATRASGLASALAWLTEMEKHKRTKPTVDLYNLVLRCCCLSLSEDPAWSRDTVAMQCEFLLERMRRNGSKPNHETCEIEPVSWTTMSWPSCGRKRRATTTKRREKLELRRLLEIRSLAAALSKACCVFLPVRRLPNSRESVVPLATVRSKVMVNASIVIDLFGGSSKGRGDSYAAKAAFDAAAVPCQQQLFPQQHSARWQHVVCGCPAQWRLHAFRCKVNGTAPSCVTT